MKKNLIFISDVIDVDDDDKRIVSLEFSERQIFVTLECGNITKEHKHIYFFLYI